MLMTYISGMLLTHTTGMYINGGHTLLFDSLDAWLPASKTS